MLSVLATAIVALAAGPTTFSFDDLKPGPVSLPWKAEGTGGPAAAWEITPDPTAPSKPNTLLLAKPHKHANFNLCWTTGTQFTDGTLELALKPISGKLDQGGGPAWRIKDNDNYYVCRANPLEENFRVYRVVAGSRTQLATADAACAAGQWHTIKVEHTGDQITCWLDGKRLLETKDSALPARGGVGVWTKSDAATAFDDLKVTPKP